MLAILAWSFACGMPLALTTGTLAAYLVQSHVSLQTIGLFSLAALPYSLKFIFAPLVQNKSIPILCQYFGRVRSWMILAIIGMMLGLVVMGHLSNFSQMIWPLFLATTFTVLCSSVNDTAEAEYRIELLRDDEFGYGMACYAIGYRLGMIMGGGGALLFAASLSWSYTYYLMAVLLGIGLIAVLKQPHAQQTNPAVHHTATWQSYLYPLKQLLDNPGWIYALVLIVIYNYADDLLNMMLNPFLLNSGFSIAEIGIWQGSVGGIIGMVGGFIGGTLLHRYGLTRMLMWCVVMLIISNMLFIPLAHYANPESLSPAMHYLFRFQAIIGNFIQGISAIAYICFIAKQCNPPYTATQNAFLTSIMAASKVLFATFGGYLVVWLGWPNFFIHIVLVSIPIFILLWLYKNTTVNRVNYA